MSEDKSVFDVNAARDMTHIAEAELTMGAAITMIKSAARNGNYEVIMPGNMLNDKKAIVLINRGFTVEPTREPPTQSHESEHKPIIHWRVSW